MEKPPLDQGMPETKKPGIVFLLSLYTMPPGDRQVHETFSLWHFLRLLRRSEQSLIAVLTFAK